MNPVAWRELFDRRIGIGVWSLGYLLMVVITTASFPSINQSSDVQWYINNELPAAFRALLGSGYIDFTTGAGYVNSRLMSLALPVMLLVYAVGFGARAVAGEHESDRLDLVLAYPVSRRDLIGSKAGVLLGITTYFVLLTMLAIWLTGLLVDLELGPDHLAAATLMLIAFGMFFGGMATFIGCWRLDRTAAVAVPAAVALGGWLLNSVAAVAEWLEPARTLSPLWWFTRRNSMVQGLDVTAFVLLAGGALVLFVASAIVFERRDLA